MKVFKNGSSEVVPESDDYNDYDEVISKCDILSKPSSLQRCNVKSCGSQWHYTPWSEVSYLTLVYTFTYLFLYC